MPTRPKRSTDYPRGIRGGAATPAPRSRRCTLIDPVCGQVYYYSSASGASRWSPPTWMDYWDVNERCVYYVHTKSGDSAWEKPSCFDAEAEAVDEPDDVGDDCEEVAEAKASSSPRPAAGLKEASPVRKAASPVRTAASPVRDKENVSANLDGIFEKAVRDDLSKTTKVLFSYTKRPRAPWDPRGKAAKKRTPRDTKTRASDASLPSVPSPEYVPSRRLQFGDTLVLAGLDLD